MPADAKLGLGAVTVVTPQFWYFTILPGATSGFDFLSNVWLANLGITYQGRDHPFGDGAAVNRGSLTSGGITRPAISCFPPMAELQSSTIFPPSIE